jgi:hypothetical protein
MKTAPLSLESQTNRRNLAQRGKKYALRPGMVKFDLIRVSLAKSCLYN